MKYLLLPLVFLASFAQAQTIPLSKKNWTILKYSNIGPNEVSFNKKGLNIKVNKSASPLIYQLTKPILVQSIYIDAQIKGKIRLKKSIQGSEENDDFLLRVGLVYAGKRTLNFIQRKFSPEWIKKLFSLAPPKTGVDHIFFLNVYSDDRLENTSRTHPKSKLLIENFSIKNFPHGKIQVKIPLSSTKKVLAIWVSSDGDDTLSSYSVQINNLRLN